MKNKKMLISVALCTCNGGNYVLEQLNSIAEQECLPSELVICDDSSDDNTVMIINKFAETAPFLVRIFCNEIRLGVIKNFEKAVSLCEGKYIALCDQDDVWLPTKIGDSLNSMRSVEKEFGELIPLLVHSDLCVVDKDCNVINPSFMALQKIHHEEENPLKVLLTQNFVTGCTVLMNRILVEKSLPIPQNVLMHDWWFALVAATMGKIILAPHPNILYRQHGYNEVGARGFFTIRNLKKIFILSSSDKIFAETFIQVMTLKEYLKEQLKLEKLVYLQEYIDVILQGGIRAAFTVHKLGIIRQGFVRQMLCYLLIIRCQYKKFI